MTKLVHSEAVAAAAQSIVERGGRVSVRTVIAALGGGSPNVVSPLVTEWKVRQAALPVPNLTIDPGIVQLIAKQVFTAVAEATAEADARAAEISADSETIAEAGRAAEALAARLQLDLNTANERLQQQTGQLEERAREIQQVKADCAEQVAVALEKAQSERDTAESVRQDLVRANIRVEAVPRLEAENMALQNRLREAETTLAAARQSEAVATAKQGSETVRASECMAREKLALEQIQRLESALDESRVRERATSDRAQQLERELAVAQTNLAALKVKVSSAGVANA